MSAATHSLEAGDNFPVHKKRVGECHSPTLFFAKMISAFDRLTILGIIKKLVLVGEVAAPCSLQSAIARVMPAPRLLLFEACPM